MQPLSGPQMLRGFNRREEGARSSIFYLYYSDLLTMARKMTGDSSDAEDLVADVFEILCKNTKPFKELDDLRNFLMVSTKNLCLNYIRNEETKKKKHAELEKQLSSFDEATERAIEYSETRSLIYKSIGRLPPNMKTVFTLRYYNQWSNAMVADHLQIPEKTVSNRYTEARKKIKWDLERARSFVIHLLNFFL